jgi:zinc D-Ala-D-Ala carboxypeptidase
MKLSANFTLEEFIHSDTAIAHHIDNNPTAQHLRNMIHWTAPGMENVRVICGNNRINVHVAYRNPVVNKLVGGTATSAHPMGFAVDYDVQGQTPLETCRLIAAAMKAKLIAIDQLILESGRGNVHCSFDPRGALEGYPSKARGMMGHQPGGPGTPIDWNFFK